MRLYNTLIITCAIGVLSCQTLQGKTPARSMAMKAGWSDVNYTFGRDKLKQATDSFHFMRSFVDYFYLLVAKNVDSISLKGKAAQFPGKCVGDAHAENFGFLLQDGEQTKFVMNDVDDFGPCPIIFDTYRFLVSSYIFDPTVDLDSILQAYIQGLNNEQMQMPAPLKTLKKQSLRLGAEVNPKKVSNQKLVRDKKSGPVDSAALADLQSAILKVYPDAQILDSMTSEKTGGGSGGMRRFEVLISEGGELRHLEFKQQIQSSLYPIATGPTSDIQAKVLGAIAVEQGSSALKDYGYTKVSGLDMFVRPILWGNAGVNLAKFSTEENQDIIRFEAFTLGQIHRQSVADPNAYMTALQSIASEDLAADVKTMADFFNTKFQALKGN